MKDSKKKLLILGGAPNETTLVKRAQELGFYVIVADYYTDLKLSPAKAFADEAWNVNWTDVDLMTQLCSDNHVDGITAGYSEVKIEYLIKICKRLNLPCYCTNEQLEVTRNKVKFKALCRECGVPTVREFSSVNDVDSYPVIVKPTDRAGSIGVGIAQNYSELLVAYDVALEKSYSKNVIIEEYITDRKIDVYYLVNDGEISILTTNDVIMAKDNGFQKVVQSCWLYPHRELENFKIKVDEKLRKMIKSMGITYGCIFFSGFIDKKQNYKFFECGFRLEGAHQYNYTYKSIGINFLDVFINHAIYGNLKQLIHNPLRNEKLKLAIINVFSKEGKIASIDGVEEISTMPDCSLALIKANEGDECRDGAILSKVGQFEFDNESPDELAKDIQKLYDYIKVLDTSGNNLIYDVVDDSLVSSWW